MRAAERRWKPQEALDLVVSNPGCLTQLAAINLWRTATGPQLTAITGRKGRNTSTDLPLLWAAELIQKGHIVNGAYSTSALPKLYRPDIRAGAINLERRLTYSEWVGLTAGQPWSSGSQFDRHNLLTVELSIRAAEFCAIGQAFGEGLGTWPLLFGPDHPLVQATSKRAADAVWVRPDGLRIAVEATASISSATRDKVAKWASALAEDSSRSLMVVFVDVSAPDKRDGHRVGGVVRKIISEEANSSMDMTLAGVPERMAFARWQDWFPAPGMVNPTFLGLSAQRPTGPPASRWEPADLLDPFSAPFSPPDPEKAKAVLANSNLLYGVPHWLKTGHGPDLDAVVRQRAGLPPVVPMTPERRAHLDAIRQKVAKTTPG
jgi:hypothetical protein